MTQLHRGTREELRKDVTNRINPWPVQAASAMALTSIENVSKAGAASTALLIRIAGTGAVASALAVRAFLDAIPVPRPVTGGEAGPAPVSPSGGASGQAGRSPGETSSQALAVREPNVIEPHDAEQVAHATRAVAEAAVAADVEQAAAAERVAEEASSRAVELAEEISTDVAEIADDLEDVADEATDQGDTDQDGDQVDVPPIEGWDQLTLASARARMRRLSQDEVEALLAYEQSHAARDSFVTMLQNRLAKLQMAVED